MPSDNLDKKIKAAAAKVEPVYTEQAWQNMERLLNIEMPQKKAARRRIFFILFFLSFISATVFLVIPWHRNEGLNITEKESNRHTPVNSGNNKISKIPYVTSKKNDSLSFKQTLFVTKRMAKKSFTKNNRRKQIQEDKNKIEIETNLIPITPYMPYKETIHNLANEDRASNFLLKQKDHLFSLIKTENNKNEAGNKQGENTKNTTLSFEIPNDGDSLDNVSKLAKKQNSFKNSFELNFSIGPDISALNFDNQGKIKPIYGAGIKYTAGKKWSIRAGIYFEDKVYGANPSDYHPPTGFWNYYPDLKNIDANCNVVEVPLIVNYNFKVTSKHQWFVSAGISSFFMKKEKYDLISKNSTGQIWYNNYTISNKNKHYLSSIRLSGGYENKLSSATSFIVEPYINVPLSGVGFGKVKLYSAGILFTVSMKPFAKK